MNELQIFKNPELGEIRVALLNGEPILSLHDSSVSLGYTKMSKGKRYVRKEEIENICKTLDITGLSPSDNRIEITKDIDFENIWIEEQDFYDLCFESKAKNAKKLRKWVTSEVLPSIRKTGSYSIRSSEPSAITGVTSYIKVLYRSMEKQGHSQKSIAEMIEMVAHECNLPIPQGFVKESHFEQMSLTINIGRT